MNIWKTMLRLHCENNMEKQTPENQGVNWKPWEVVIDNSLTNSEEPRISILYPYENHLVNNWFSTFVLPYQMAGLSTITT